MSAATCCCFISAITSQTNVQYCEALIVNSLAFVSEFISLKLRCLRFY